MARITQLENVNNTQFNTVLGNVFTSRQCFHAATGIEFWLTMAGPRGDHFDVTPTTEADAKILEKLINRVDLNRWTAEPIIVIVNGKAYPAGLALFMHAARMGKANPGAKYPSMSNTMPASGWPRGGHLCLYVLNSTGGAGDGNNPLVSSASNTAAGTARGRQARAAAHEALLLSRTRPIVLDRINSVLFPTSPPIAGIIQYTVQPGDSWGLIAKNHGLNNAELQALNPDHKDINVIFAGVTVLNVPAKSGTVPAPTPTPQSAAPSFKEYNVKVTLSNITSSLNIREHPNTNATTKIVGSLRHNDERTVIAAQSGWLRVRHSNGTILGWISEQFTKKV